MNKIIFHLEDKTCSFYSKFQYFRFLIEILFIWPYKKEQKFFKRVGEKVIDKKSVHQ